MKIKRLRSGYRSKFEQKIADWFKLLKIPFSYESLKIPYVVPEKLAHYTPDFVLKNGIIIEAKGEFSAHDRIKHLLIKQQHPELDIRFLFMRQSVTLNKRSKTTYADWCIKYGFQFAEKTIPAAWLKQQ